MTRSVGLENLPYELLFRIAVDLCDLTTQHTLKAVDKIFYNLLTSSQAWDRRHKHHGFLPKFFPPGTGKQRWEFERTLLWENIHPLKHSMGLFHTIFEFSSYLLIITDLVVLILNLHTLETQTYKSSEPLVSACKRGNEKYAVGSRSMILVGSHQDPFPKELSIKKNAIAHAVCFLNSTQLAWTSQKKISIIDSETGRSLYCFKPQSEVRSMDLYGGLLDCLFVSYGPIFHRGSYSIQQDLHKKFTHTVVDDYELSFYTLSCVFEDYWVADPTHIRLEPLPCQKRKSAVWKTYTTATIQKLVATEAGRFFALLHNGTLEYLDPSDPSAKPLAVSTALHQIHSGVFSYPNSFVIGSTLFVTAHVRNIIPEPLRSVLNAVCNMIPSSVEERTCCYRFIWNPETGQQYCSLLQLDENDEKLLEGDEIFSEAITLLQAMSDIAGILKLNCFNQSK